jgi:hypothetical protein
MVLVGGLLVLWLVSSVVVLGVCRSAARGERTTAVFPVRIPSRVTVPRRRPGAGISAPSFPKPIRGFTTSRPIE